MPKNKITFRPNYFLSIIFGGCSSSRENLIIGKWQSEAGKMQFFEDENVIMDNSSVAGMYSIIDESHIRFGNALSAFVMEFEVSWSTLILIDGDERIEFARADD